MIRPFKNQTKKCPKSGIQRRTYLVCNSFVDTIFSTWGGSEIRTFWRSGPYGPVLDFLCIFRPSLKQCFDNLTPLLPSCTKLNSGPHFRQSSAPSSENWSMKSSVFRCFRHSSVWFSDVYSQIKLTLTIDDCFLEILARLLKHDLRKEPKAKFTKRVWKCPISASYSDCPVIRSRY